MRISRAAIAARTLSPVICIVVSCLASVATVAQTSMPAALTADVPPEERAALPLAGIRAAAPASQATESNLDAQPDVRSLLETARSRLEDGNVPEAADRLREAALKAGTNDYYDLEYLRAQIALASQALDAALEAARRAAALRPQSVDANYLVGTLYADRSDFARAILYLRAATQSNRELSNSNSSLAWLKLAACLVQERYLLAASEAFAKFDAAIWVNNPEHRNHPEIARWLADQPRGGFEDRLELAAQLKRPKDVLRVTSEALDRWPDDVYVARRQGFALLDNGRAADALQLAKEWIYKPRGIPGVVGLAIEAARAARSLDAWIDETATEIRAGRSFELGDALVARLISAKEYKSAAAIAEALISRERSVDANNWRLAVARWQAGDRATAIAGLAVHVRKQGDAFDPSPRLVALWTRATRDAGVVASLVAEYRKGGDHDFARDYVLALAAIGSDQMALADSLLKSCADQRPEFAAADVARGRVLLASYDWDAAAALARATIKKRADFAPAVLQLAQALDGLDENDEARQTFQRAIRLAPKDASYPLALARHLQRLNEALGAERYFGEAMLLDPDCEEAMEGQLESYLSSNKEELARELFRQIERTAADNRSLRRLALTYRYRNATFVPSHLSELRSLLAGDPGDLEAGRTLAQGLLILDQLDEAEAVLKQVLAADPSDYMAQLQFARLQMRKLEHEKAVESLETLLKRFPHRTLVLELLAGAYIADFRPREARSVLDRLVQRGGETAEEIEDSLFTTFMTFGEWDDGLAYVDKAAKANPPDARSAARRIDLLHGAGRCDEVREIARADLAGNENDRNERMKYIQTLMFCNDYKTAEVKLREWTSDGQSGGDIDWNRQLILVLMADGRGKEALPLIKARPTTNPREVFERRRLMGQAEAAAGDFKAAIAEYEALLKERMFDERSRATVIAALVGALAADGRIDAALERTNELFPHPETPDERLQLLEARRAVLQNTERESEYTRVLEQMHEMLPENPGLNNDLGYTWVDQGIHVEKALGMIRKAVADEPVNSAYLDSLGWAYYKLGQFDPARKYLSRAVALPTGKDPVLHDHNGDVEYRLGDAAAAKQHWELAVAFAEKQLKDLRAPRPDRERLLTALRGKLAALERSDKPAVAPTAAEHQKK